MKQSTEEKQIELDQAEMKGEMVYPPILGQEVRVRFFGKPTFKGKVSAVGPLGFLLSSILEDYRINPKTKQECKCLVTKDIFFSWENLSIDLIDTEKVLFIEKENESRDIDAREAFLRELLSLEYEEDPQELERFRQELDVGF